MLTLIYYNAKLRHFTGFDSNCGSLLLSFTFFRTQKLTITRVRPLQFGMLPAIFGGLQRPHLLVRLGGEVEDYGIVTCRSRALLGFLSLPR